MNKKNVIIFGANGGLGKEILINLIEKDLNLFLSVKNTKTKRNILKKLKSIQRKKIKFFEICDFSNEKSIENFFIKLKNKKINIDLAFNCIGYFDYDKVEKLNLKKLNLNLKLNLISSIIITSKLLKFTNKKNILKIFHIGSSSSYDGFPNTTYYCAAKHALVGAIKSMNKETIKNNTINYLVSMGSMKTKMGKKVRYQNYNKFLQTDKVSEFIINLAFLDINGYTEEVLIKRFIK